MNPRLLPVLASLASACASLPKPAIPVGTQALSVSRGTRVLAPLAWFPAAKGAPLERIKPRPIFSGVVVAPAATPALVEGQKRPLIIVSAGNWGTAYSQGWLATTLVEQGYLVVSLAHPGTNADTRTPEGRVRLWDRARDVSAVLDEVLTRSSLAPFIDPQRIGFVGHSFGGWTGVALAGGVHSAKVQREACLTATPADAFCSTIREDGATGVSLEGDETSHRDQRIRAFVLLAAGPSAGFSEQSLTSISAAMLVVVADQDEILPTKTHAERFGLIPGAKLEHLTAGHFDFIPACNRLGKIVRPQLCSQQTNVEREVIHDQTRRTVLAFLDAILGVAP